MFALEWLTMFNMRTLLSFRLFYYISFNKKIKKIYKNAHERPELFGNRSHP